MSIYRALSPRVSSEQSRLNCSESTAGSLRQSGSEFQTVQVPPCVPMPAGAHDLTCSSAHTPVQTIGLQYGQTYDTCRHNCTDWLSASKIIGTTATDPSIWQPGFDLPRRSPSLLHPSQSMSFKIYTDGTLKLGCLCTRT